MKHLKWTTIKKDIISAYDADVQKRLKAKKQKWKREERKLFFNYLCKEKKQSLLEIGAGTGQDSEYFIKKGLKVIAIDISPQHVQHCKKRGCKARVLDMYDLHTLKKKYDAVYALSSLVHVPKSDFERILRKIKGVLKPGGLFYLGMYGGVNVEGIYRQDHCRPKRFFSFYYTSDLLAIMQKHFFLEYFKRIVPFKDGGTYQSMILRKH